MTYLDEAQVEIVTVGYFRALRYEYSRGPGPKPCAHRRSTEPGSGCRQLQESPQA